MKVPEDDRVARDAPLEHGTRHQPLRNKPDDLIRLTVNLVPRAHAAMLLAAQITGYSRTDTVNRALQLYAFAENEMSRGGEILIRSKNGETQLIKFM